MISNVLTVQWLFSEHVEVIHGIEHGNVIPEIRTYKQVVDIENCIDFVVLEEKNLVLSLDQPWWKRLTMGRLAYYKTTFLFLRHQVFSSLKLGFKTL